MVQYGKVRRSVFFPERRPRELPKTHINRSRSSVRRAKRGAKGLVCFKYELVARGLKFYWLRQPWAEARFVQPTSPRDPRCLAIRASVQAVPWRS